MRAIRSQDGQTSAEYLGVIVVIAAIIGVLAAGGPAIGGLISSRIGTSLCEIGGGGCGSMDVNSDGSSDGVLIDTDGDGEADAVDVNGDGAPDGAAIDTDGDGTPDAVDANGDGKPDRAFDLDGDGRPDGIDVNGDGVADGEAVDVNSDGIPDGIDVNGDGHPDGLDTDGDGIADAAVMDGDGDGISDAVDVDGDGRMDGALVDIDGDGQADGVLADLDCDGMPDGVVIDADGDGKFDGVDTDGDGEIDQEFDDGGGGGIGGFFHGVLDGCGLIPGLGEACDGVNALWYTAEGDYVNAGLSAAGMIPFAGWGATGAKWGLKYGDEAAGIVRQGDEAAGASRFGDEAVAPAKRTSGQTVLGHYPEYVELSDAINARRFDIPENVWKNMTDAQRWEANQKFLDRTIARGDEIVLATPIDKVRPGSYYERELNYLMSKGYTVSPDGTRLLPPGGG